MNRNRLFIIFALMCSCPLSSMEVKRVKCYKCESTCIESTGGKAKELTVKLNESCTSDCLNFPFNVNGNELYAEECLDTSESCFTAHAIFKYRVLYFERFFVCYSNTCFPDQIRRQHIYIQIHLEKFHVQLSKSGLRFQSYR